ncbi:uncharacterized protein LOC142750296 isoform X2 [Rhinoderma darwinii]|uniref:uncharacterized protein LOC142750296 isoform X2 n=1 Tax=Rhinoderma darwinii TaxID=43563 RepID=UPI003F6818FC
MVLTVQEVLVRALKKLEDSSFQRFIEKLSVLEVREQYKNIPKDELSGKDPEHIVGMINEYYRYAYGAEVTLDVLEDIDEKNVREELQHELMEVDISGYGLGTKMFTDRVDFIDRHRSDLIRKLWSVDLVLRDLRDQDLLTTEQYKDLMKKRTTREKMRDLCDIIRYWEDTGKYTAYKVIQKRNKSIIKSLEAKDWIRINPRSFVWSRDHLVNRHRSHLIYNINKVNPVLDDLRSNHLLTQKQCEDFQAMTTSKIKMKYLCDLLQHQSDSAKDQFYVSLWKYNYTVINNLEKSDKKKKTSESLTRCMPEVGQISYRNVSENEQKPHPLRAGVGYKSNGLSKTWMKTVRSKWSRKRTRKFTARKYVTQASQEIEETQMSCVKRMMTVDNMSCKLCGTAQDLTDLVIPIGSIYKSLRLELQFPGLYRCQKTGIKFLVKSPVTIEYKLDSWSDHSKALPNYSYEILGPLFNITCEEPNAVSAVYLPHYLCLKGFTGRTDLIKCAHFRDGNLSLETPTQIEPFYITLENPTYSCLGPILSFRKKKIPIHGIVLIYFRILCKGEPEEELKIHLYVLPYMTNAEETLKFDSEPYQSTEIRLKEKEIDICLYVSEENSEDTVWDTHLTQSDVKDITQLLSQIGIHENALSLSEHFVDRHREALIQRTSNMSQVLDNLLTERLLTQEQHDTVRNTKPHQEAMRQLYIYMTIWGYGDKEKFFQALKSYNRPLIRDLEDKDTIKM